MADLRALVSDLGHTDVATYIQSGNVAFTSATRDARAVASGLERAIADRLDVQPKVVVLSCDELALAVAADPYPHEANPRCLHAVFRMEAPGPDEGEIVAAAVERARLKGSGDEAQVVGCTLYLRTPDGLGRSVLAVTGRPPPCATGPP